MNPVEFTTAIVAIANAIACNLSDDDLDLTAAVFSQLGSTLAFIALQRGLQNKNALPNEEQSQPLGDTPLLPLL